MKSASAFIIVKFNITLATTLFKAYSNRMVSFVLAKIEYKIKE